MYLNLSVVLYINTFILVGGSQMNQNLPTLRLCLEFFG